MLRELRGDPDRYTPPHLRGGAYKPSTRTSATSPTSPTFCQDVSTSSETISSPASSSSVRDYPDRYTPPHLRGCPYTTSSRTPSTSRTSPTFYKDAKNSHAQYDESNCENIHKFENQCLDPGLRQDVQIRAGPSPEFSWSSTSSSSPGSGAQSYERFTTLTSTSRLAVCDQQDADLSFRPTNNVFSYATYTS